ncbi:hypothetical protein SAMN05444395_101451 [Flavobacterium fryxellicola]|nr:hypothetical protein SAMN05444395_101451 [Flavobacterium fryxellicola]
MKSLFLWFKFSLVENFIINLIGINFENVVFIRINKFDYFVSIFQNQID